MWGVLLVVVCLAVSPSSAADERMPPTIIQGSIASKIYRLDEEIQLDCGAIGTPKPSYEWYKNGMRLQPSPNIIHVSDGSIMIRPLSSLDEGFYQCRASNMWGTTLSNVTHLQRAILNPYGQPQVTEKRGLQEGQPFMLEYIGTKCVPKPAFTWGVANDVVDKSQTTIVPDKRIQIDEDGNLHFSYLTMADSQNGKLYKCNVYNPYLDLTHGGSYARLEIRPSPEGVRKFSPVYGFSSTNPVIALLTRNVTLRCFFSGYPDPSLTWSKVGGSLPIGRYQIVNHNTELIIRDVQQSDEGDYNCRAANTEGYQDHRIQIDVQAIPVFKQLADRPHNMNVTVGQRVTINCITAAEPEVTNIVWMKNGEPLDPSRLPPRMHLSKSGLQLTINDVCKDCDDDSSDLQVIQCNATNAHGYAFADGYINVLLKTDMVTKPTSVHLAYDDTAASFYCAAVSDDSTPVTIQWFHEDAEGYESLVRNVTDRISIIDGGRTLSLTVPENSTGSWTKLRGIYRCRASNGYSQEVAEATLVVDSPPGVTEIIVLPPEQVSSAGIGDWWWLFVILALILLLLILLICCCICLQRRRGDTYKVDEKERKNGNDPEKELADSGFHDYRRPDSEPMKGSRASLVSSKLSEDDDASSLNEYGDIDAGKFTEDGSFIGDYGTERSRRATGRINNSSVA